MSIREESSHVVIDGIMYPKINEWHRWLQQQTWPCEVGVHYFLPAGTRPHVNATLCVCGRCGMSTWWKGSTWTLDVHFGYWTQAGRPIPEWCLKQPTKHGRGWLRLREW